MLTGRGRCAPGLGPLFAGLAALVGVLAVTACGSGADTSSSSGASSSAAASSNPQTLLKQTFSSAHTVTSGVLRFSLVLTPTGSSTLTGPVSLTLSGPFQSRGAHQTPESDFTVAVSGLHKQASFGVISTASGAYIRLQGVAYQLPAAAFKKLQSSVEGNASAGSAPGLSSLGIDPEHWLTSPAIVGTETVDGARTEHLRAALNVTAFVSDLNRLLAKEPTTTAKAGIPTRISPAAARKLAATIRDPTVDVWTGTSDTTLRRLTVSAAAPVTGTTSTELGGLTSAAVRMTINYAQLNHAQTIVAPAHVHSYAELQTKVDGLAEELEGTVGATGATGAGTSSAGRVSKYAQCINGAGGDVSKMQKCSSLLGTGTSG